MAYNLLIADDMLVNRKLMKKVLEVTLSDSVFFEAEDGFKAIEIVENEDIDLIILDLMMPGKDGYEVLREIKGNDRHKDIPIIVNSALTDMDSIKQTLELGAIDYFTKPITPEQMKVIIPLKASNALKYYEQKKILKEINQRMEMELKIASMLQKALIEGPHKLRNVDVYKRYIPCDELGGDLYDYVELGDTIWFIIADITGHGAASAMVSSMLKAVFNYSIELDKSPKEVLKDINSTFYNMMPDNSRLFFSAFIGVIKDNTLTYSNAGHPYPILIKPKQKKSIHLELNGNLIGVFKESHHENRRLILDKDDVLLLYTDGLYDGNKGEIRIMNSHDLVLDCVSNNYDYEENNPEIFINKLLSLMGIDKDKNAADDVAIVIFKVK